MKKSTLKFVLVILFMNLSSVNTYLSAQTCMVLDTNLKGSYVGNCKSGKADGQGTAIGQHQYEGYFKAGYPDGEGIYTDEKGNTHKGSYKKGKKEGPGTAHIKTDAGIESIITGFWKKDVYIGAFEAPFKILSKTYMVNTVSIQAETANQFPTIEVSLESVTGGSVDLHGEIPKPVISEVIFNKGSYNVMNVITTQQKKNVYILNNLIYPATVIFKIGSEEVQIDFNENKNYKVSIVLRS